MSSLSNSLVVVLENKGGVGKSTLSGIVAATATGQGLRIRFADSDMSNSSTAQVQPDTYPVDLREDEASGTILVILAEIANGTFEVGIWDTGAREEPLVRKTLEKIRSTAAQLGVALVIFRPITTNHFVQDNAIDCIPFAKKNGFGVVYATILAQGRREKDMMGWRISKARSEASEYAVEIDIESMGAVIADNASSFSMSFSDVALGRFDNVPERYRERAKEKFGLEQQMFMAAFLEQMTTRVGSAVAEARKRMITGSDRKKATTK